MYFRLLIRTSLRVGVVRRRSRPLADPLRVIGIDDWAWRCNHRYASIICNLERRRVVALLPDREPATAQAWLATHPTIAIVARARGEANVVADRFDCQQRFRRRRSRPGWCFGRFLDRPDEDGLPAVGVRSKSNVPSVCAQMEGCSRQWWCGRIAPIGPEDASDNRRCRR